MDHINILVTSAGVASAVNVIKSLRLQKEFDVSINAVDVDQNAAGLHLADYSYASPPIAKPDDYLNFLYEICKQHNVKALYPCYSKELPLIAKASDTFRKLGVGTLLPSPDVIELCDNKYRMYSIVKDNGIPIPDIIGDPNSFELPLFSKPLKGSSSTGAIYVDNEHLLKSLLFSQEKRVYQKFINGDEYTVDVLCDKKSNVLFAGPRKRIATKAGQTVKGLTVHNEILNSYVKRICKLIGMTGVCNIQFIEKNGKYFFIEINPRYAAGGLMLTVHAGANLPLAALKLMLGLQINKYDLKHTPNVMMIRYWEEIITKEI